MQVMELLLEFIPNSVISTSAEAVNETLVDDDPAPIRGSTSQLAEKPHCLWCGREFTRRATGGSAQRFCCLAHRKAFWTAARRWTMRAIEAGLLSVDCLKTAQTSVHAAAGAFRSERTARF
jgi:hypothetical protein